MMNRTGAMLIALLMAGCAWAPPAKQGGAAEAIWPEPDALGHAAGREAPVEPRVVPVHPEPGSVLPIGRPVLVSGWALPRGAKRPRRDVVVVIDVSGSTEEDAVEPKGWIPFTYERPRAKKGSILDVEILSADTLVRNLDRQFTRVGLVTFSGEVDGHYSGIRARNMAPGRRRRPHAIETSSTALPLGNHYENVEPALEGIRKAGPLGATDMAAGLRHATAELVGGPGAASTPRMDAERAIVFLTDGVPTLPYPGDKTRNELAVVLEVRRAAAYGIRVHSFGVGKGALEGPFALVQMADLSGGSFTPVMDPSDLPAALEIMDLSGVASVEVRNATTREPALKSALLPDGRFDALLRLAAGRNEIQIYVEFSDGTHKTHTLPLVGAADVAAPTVPDYLVPRRGELLDGAAAELRERRRIELLARVREDIDHARAWAETRRRELELALEEAP